MIHGIGVDIVEVDRMRNIIIKHGDKFSRKILTPSEQLVYDKSTNKAQYMAKCWAVKEAFVKALGTGFSKDYSWSTIGYFTPTVSYGTSRPQVRLKQKLEGKTIHLSASDEKRYVIAYVTIEETKNEQRSKLR